MMAKPQPARTRPAPQRMCIACRQGAGKRALIRIVRTPEGVQVDPTGKQSGRGAYLHPAQSCWQKALTQGMIGRSLRVTLSPAEVANLQAYAQTLPETLDDVGQGD
jgi:predicted RNA-binding protein YlxR (DUF448 family)